MSRLFPLAHHPLFVKSNPYDLRDEFASLRYVRTHTSFPVPTVYFVPGTLGIWRYHFGGPGVDICPAYHDLPGILEEYVWQPNLLVFEVCHDQNAYIKSYSHGSFGSLISGMLSHKP